MAKRTRGEFFKYRVIVATVISVLIAWLTLAVLTSVGRSVYGGGDGKARVVKLIRYSPGGDNQQALTKCSRGLRRLFHELRSRLNGVAAEPVGEKAGRRWQQWMDHYQHRLGQHRRRCLIGRDGAVSGDPVLDELRTAAEGLEDLAEAYERAHSQVVGTFEEDFIALEGVFARAEARLAPKPR